MSRSVSVKYGGKQVKLVASFAAARDLCDNVHDLLGLFNDQQRALLFIHLGRQYSAEFKWSIDTVSRVIEIGLQHGGVDTDAEAVGAFMVEIGLDKAQKLAQDYLSLFFAEPETKAEDTKGGDGKK